MTAGREGFVRIGSAWWRIVFEEPKDPDADGECHEDIHTILVRPGMAAERTVDTLLHEIAHAALPYLHEGPIEELGAAQQRGLRWLTGVTPE